MPLVPVSHAALVLAIVGVVTGTSAASQPVPRLEIETRALASENPLLLPEGDTHAGMIEVTARPGIQFAAPTGTSFDLGAVLTARRYTRRYGGFLIGRVDAIAEHRDSEFLSYKANAGFARDVAVDLLTSSVESSVDPTSIRNALVGGASATFRPNERTWIQPEFSFEQFRYARSALIGNTRSISASLSVRRRAGPLTTFGIRGGSILSDTARLASTDTEFLYATVDRRLSTSWRLTGELGAERIGARVETLLGISAAQPARLRLSGRAQLCREAPGPAICTSAALNSEVSGLGGLQRRAVVAASVDHRIAERTTLALDAEYQRTVMQGDLFPDFDAIRAVALVERQVQHNLRLGATMQYLRRRLIDGRRVGAAFAGLQVTFAPALR